MNPKTSQPARLLKPLLILIGVVQIVLGMATALIPEVFFEQMGLSTPPLDTQYMLAMLASRFVAFGVAFLLNAIQALDLLAGLVHTGLGSVSLGVSGFPMFNALLFAVLLFRWMPPAETARQYPSQ